MVLEKTTKELEAVFDCVGACVCVFDVLAWSLCYSVFFFLIFKASKFIKISMNPVLCV